jgi:hypothetical protein
VDKILKIVLQAFSQRCDWLEYFLVVKEMRLMVCGSQLGNFYDLPWGNLPFRPRLENKIAKFRCFIIISLFDGRPLASKMMYRKSWSIIHLLLI